jgi:circadian clock protein KaiC
MPALAKAPTGITGLDETTGGGFPRGRATLIEGGPGCGKTILALQSLVNGALLFNEPGIFVAFEESPTQIMANVANFGWDLADLQRRKLLFFLDARPDSDLIQSGDFDLTGMLLAE